MHLVGNLNYVVGKESICFMVVDVSFGGIGTPLDPRIFSATSFLASFLERPSPTYSMPLDV